MNEIMIIGEAWGREEEEARTPFVGAAGKLLRSFLHRTGIDPRACYMTNVFNLRPQPTNDIFNLCGVKKEGVPGYPALGPAKYIKLEYAAELTRLHQEILDISPNIILALGNTAVTAITKQKLPIGTYRGTPAISAIPNPATGEGFKYISTYHPNAVLREWAHSVTVLADLAKVKRHSTSPEFKRKSREIWIEPTLFDIEEFFTRHMHDADRPCAVDIETAGGTITEVGFGYPELGIVIPFYTRVGSHNYWESPEEEVVAWQLIASILRHLRCPVFQNGLYDLNWLWTKMRIQVPHAGEDTMLLHHALQPELKKGLAFLGSLHTDEPSWKLMRRATLKKEE